MKNVSVYDKMTNAEKEVADLLKDLGIFWKYEKPVYVKDNNNRPRVWTPDFYLPSFGIYIYIEVCGSKNFNYEYRKKIFNKNGYEVIFLHLFKRKHRWRTHLIKYLRKNIRIKKSRIKKNN